jgi:hypothetical protein
LNVHWIAATGFEKSEERERLSVAVPPGGAVADESAKLVWACKELLSGNKRTVRTIILISPFVFDRYTVFLPRESLPVEVQD